MSETREDLLTGPKVCRILGQNYNRLRYLLRKGVVRADAISARGRPLFRPDLENLVHIGVALDAAEGFGRGRPRVNEDRGAQYESLLRA